jgi:Skp family chaperone for outer membrane proteins
MNSNSLISRLGWVVAALCAAIMIGSGFQENSNKIGVVDITSVIERSKYGQTGQALFAEMKSVREGLLTFVQDHRIITSEQAVRLKELTLKTVKTNEEKAELERIKADILATEKKSKELELKATITPEERTLTAEFANRAQIMDQTANRWFNEFSTELQMWADNRKMESLKKAREVIQEVGKAQGYTLVLEVGIAPYGANDLTEAALKQMDARNPS